MSLAAWEPFVSQSQMFWHWTDQQTTFTETLINRNRDSTPNTSEYYSFMRAYSSQVDSEWPKWKEFPCIWGGRIKNKQHDDGYRGWGRRGQETEQPERKRRTRTENGGKWMKVERECHWCDEFTDRREGQEIFYPLENTRKWASQKGNRGIWQELL